MNKPLTSAAWIWLLVMAAIIANGASAWGVWREALRLRETQVAILAGAEEGLVAERLEELESVHGSIRPLVAEYFITETTLPDFLERLEMLGRSAGMVLTLTRAEIPEESKPAPIIEFTAEGSFVGAVRLLALVESLPARLELEEVVLSRQGAADSGKPAAWELGVKLNLRSFTPTPRAQTKQ